MGSGIWKLARKLRARCERNMSMSPNRVLVSCFTLLGSLLTSWTMAVAQICPNCASSEPRSPTPNIIEESSVAFGFPMVTYREGWSIRKRVDEVYVFFTVRKGHRYVADLTAAELKVQDDHHPVANISSFGRQTDLPMRLGLLIDTSDSVEDRFRFEKEASIHFLTKVVRQNIDRAFVLGFADQPRLTADYTDDPRQLTAGVSALRSGGNTALFDAVAQACEKLASVEEDAPVTRVLVILSDGEDNSSKITLEESVKLAERLDVTIHSISINNPSMDRPGDAFMKRLAIETGGEMFRPTTSEEMVNAFSSIDGQMRSRYVVSYHPRDLVEDGRYHSIDIIAERSNKRFRVEARKGYYAPLAKSVN